MITDYLGLQPTKGQLPSALTDPIKIVAEQKGNTPESLVALGANRLNSTTIGIPVFGSDGKQCSSFYISTDGTKGKVAKDKSAGLFLPVIAGAPRLPQPGETWLLPEGCKDPAALWSLGLLACGLNTSSMAAKFARLFRGVDVVRIPDRDKAGETVPEQPGGRRRQTGK
jgi:hypothetical protein